MQLFRPEEFWSIIADFSTPAAVGSSGSNGSSALLPAKLVSVDGQKLSQFSVRMQEQAQELEARLWQQQPPSQPSQQPSLPPLQRPAEPVYYTVKSLVKRPVKRNPPPPLVTSTLQQEAARRLGFSASKTMQVAQQLYEGANTGEGGREA